MCTTFYCELKDMKSEQTVNFRITLPSNWKKEKKKKDVTALQQTRELTGARNISHSPRTEKKKKRKEKKSVLFNKQGN